MKPSSLQNGKISVKILQFEYGHFILRSLVSLLKEDEEQRRLTVVNGQEFW